MCINFNRTLHELFLARYVERVQTIPATTISLCNGAQMLALLMVLINTPIKLSRNLPSSWPLNVLPLMPADRMLAAVQDKGDQNNENGSTRFPSKQLINASCLYAGIVGNWVNVLAPGRND